MPRQRSAPAHVPASKHNEILAAAYTRATTELEDRLAALIEPILVRYAKKAETDFRRRVTDHLTASALRRADRAAILRSGVGPRDLARLRPVLVAAGALDGVTSTSTMVCVKPRPEEAQAIADPGGAPADDLHVTLAYLGDVEDESALQAVRDALASVAATHAPLSGKVGGYGEFRPPGCGILLPDVPGLVELRVAATEALVDAGVDYGRDHGFQPHITVDGRPEDGEIDEMLARAAGAPLHFDALLVVRGDKVVLEIPLVGVLPVTASALVAAGEVDPADLAFRVTEIEQALKKLKQAIQVGDSVEIAVARSELNDAKEKLQEAVAGTPPLWTAPAGDEVVDVQSLAQEIRAKTEPARRALIQTTMTPALEQAGLSFDVTNPLTQKALASTGAKITDISETTRADAMKVIQSAWSSGLSIDHTAQMLSLVMQADAVGRARTIARTELVGAVNGGSLTATRLVADATGSAYRKSWLTASGAKYPRHELYDGLDGQTVDLDARFDVGGFPLDHPGDPEGEPGEVINCRCALQYVEADGSGQAAGDDTFADASPPPEDLPTLDTLNPTGGLNVPYAPEARAVAPLGPNMTTLDKTMGVAPDAPVTIYRGAPANQGEIAAGDFVTTNEQLAKDYAGEGDVLSKEVPASHVLDDSTEPLGEEYIYRPPVAEQVGGETAASAETYSADVGVTPFRAGEDDPVGFYESDKYGQFVSDVHDSASSYGVTVDGLDRVTGVWQGDTEPSVSLRIHDGEAGVRAYSANLGNAYHQDGVLIFGDQAAGDVMATFRSPFPQADTTAAMAKAGIDGGRFTADGRLQVIGSGPDFVKQLDSLAEDLGPYDASAGRFELLERDSGDYGKAIQAFGPPNPKAVRNTFDEPTQWGAEPPPPTS